MDINVGRDPNPIDHLRKYATGMKGRMLIKFRDVFATPVFDLSVVLPVLIGWCKKYSL